jgi:hypothetical protein
MAPLTCSRAGPGNIPNALNALYYIMRSGQSAGLLIPSHVTRGLDL